MRAFAGGFYNNLKALYDHLGVQYRPQPFLFEFAKFVPHATERRTGRRDSSYFVHASNFHQPEPRPKALSRILYAIEATYLLVCYAWFTICCLVLSPREGPRVETLGEYLHRVWIPSYFITYYILPLLSSVATCPHGVLLESPASDIVEYKRRTHRALHFTVANGVHTVQEQLVRGIDYELSAAVSAVEAQEKGVKISWNKAGGSLRTERFDRVVLAIAPDIVGRIFKPLERHMARIPTTWVESVVHTDRHATGIEDCSIDNTKGAQLIYLRTLAQGLHQTESHHVQPSGAIVTTCPVTPIDPKLAIHSAKFTRVLRTPESRRIVNSLFQEGTQPSEDEKPLAVWRNGDSGVFIVGGWCWDGMVLLEGCVVSAMRVANAFGVEVPWSA
ncbi:hypothetical protein BU23DRAFT_550924 [Bimuria novae-zelandiae CBS 107.79]|uniref:Amine oxidase domain-containing protein n=1 Tax=Bimuria novae-zelandiae CBS 107.79 TaxID=1447943 RepID=A0A6A5VKC1_9PLEO|nr:hypothetical protein BU23DRAFT_550924 [Bimuria novae-zelandiae CBS 107.79]